MSHPSTPHIPTPAVSMAMLSAWVGFSPAPVRRMLLCAFTHYSRIERNQHSVPGAVCADDAVLTDEAFMNSSLACPSRMSSTSAKQRRG